MTEEDKIKKGILFYPEDEELVAKKTRAHDLSRDFNKLYERDRQERERIISELVGEIGDGSFFLGLIAFHYGCHTSIGKDCFFNFNFTVQDDAEVTIGDNCQFGPNVNIFTPVHPLIASERKAMQRADGSVRVLCYAKPVHIGRGCWFGANVVVCPGVTIGDGCVIGAGSVVTKDIPANSLAVGNPCRVLREITEKDSMVYKPEILADNMPLWSLNFKD